MDATHKFLVNNERGEVSAYLQKVPGAKARFILGHGAGANMFHAHMQQIADELELVGIETLRFQFPYMERGGGRTDNLATCLDTIRGALTLSCELKNKLPTLLSGHSFGGRMASHYAAQDESHEISGLVYFSFPLHPSKKPGITRAAHLHEIRVPQLFISGTRDTLAELPLLEPIIGELPRAALRTLDTADHSFKILKRTRVSTENVYTEAARYVDDFVSGLTK